MLQGSQPTENPFSKDFLSLLSELGPEKLAQLVLSETVADKDVSRFFKTYEPHRQE